MSYSHITLVFQVDDSQETSRPNFCMWIAIFWVVTTCSLVGTYHTFGPTYHLHLHFSPEDGGKRVFEMLVTTYMTIWRHVQKNTTHIFIALKTSNVIEFCINSLSLQSYRSILIVSTILKIPGEVSGYVRSIIADLFHFSYLYLFVRALRLQTLVIGLYESLTAEREQVRKIHNMSFRRLGILLFPFCS
jgi:hypothetical protein